MSTNNATHVERCEKKTNEKEYEKEKKKQYFENERKTMSTRMSCVLLLVPVASITQTRIFNNSIEYQTKEQDSKHKPEQPKQPQKNKKKILLFFVTCIFRCVVVVVV